MELFVVISGACAVGTPLRAGERVCCSSCIPNIIGELVEAKLLTRPCYGLSTPAFGGSEAEPLGSEPREESRRSVRRAPADSFCEPNPPCRSGPHLSSLPWTKAVPAEQRRCAC